MIENRGGFRSIGGMNFVIERDGEKFRPAAGFARTVKTQKAPTEEPEKALKFSYSWM
jgi:hypothetical protein